MSGDRSMDFLSLLAFSLALGCSFGFYLFQPDWEWSLLAAGWVVLSIILTWSHPTRLAGLAGIGGFSVLLNLTGSQSNLANSLIILAAVFTAAAVFIKYIDFLTFPLQGVHLEDSQSIHETKN
jgi:hypothetical protein